MTAETVINICGDYRNPVVLPLPDNFRLGMAGVQCKCGRFLSAVRPVLAIAGEGYWRNECIWDIRGNCSRCGGDVQAAAGFAWSWDAWFQ